MTATVPETGPRTGTGTGTAAAAAQPLRALPVPVCEPHPSSALAPPQLEQVHPAQCTLDLVPEPRGLRPGARPRHVPLGGVHLRGVDDDLAPRRTPSADLPDPSALVRSVVCAAIEVVAGSRPAGQLLRWLTPDTYADLQRRAALAARARHRAAPVRRATVRRVRTTAPRDGVVEASVVVLEARRVRAVAVRLEGWDGRWRVTALDVG